MAYLWKQFHDQGWMWICTVIWLWSFASISFRWITAPKYKHNYKNLIAAIGVNRVTMLLATCIAIGDIKGIFALYLAYSFYWFCCDMFESAYIRCMERQTPGGVADYEALEGPSVGL